MNRKFEFKKRQYPYEIGFENFDGVSCYRNSTLQALFSIRSLNIFFKDVVNQNEYREKEHEVLASFARMIKENHDHNKTEILHAWNKFCEKYKDSNCVPYVLLYERLTSIVNDDSKVGTKELIDDSKLSSSQMSRSETIEMTGPEPQDIKRSETADMKDLYVESSIECIYIYSSESMDDTIQNESGEEDLDEIIKEKHQSSTPDCVLATEARGRSRITITRKQSKWEKLKAKKDQILRNLKGSLESTPKIGKRRKKVKQNSKRN